MLSYDSYIGDQGPWFLPENVVYNQNGLEFHIVKSDWENRQKRAILNHCKSFNVALQAGGWLGVIPRLLSNQFKKVYTLEPDYDNFCTLIANCVNNKNITAFNAALSSTSTQMEFERTITPGQHRLKSPDAWPTVKIEDTTEVQTLNIDCLNLKELDFLMIDTEGHLLEILQGAEETIKKFKPVILAETHWKKDLKYSEIAYVQSLGYSGIIDLAAEFDDAQHGDYIFKME